MLNLALGLVTPCDPISVELPAQHIAFRSKTEMTLIFALFVIPPPPLPRVLTCRSHTHTNQKPNRTRNTTRSVKHQTGENKARLKTSRTNLSGGGGQAGWWGGGGGRRGVRGEEQFGTMFRQNPPRQENHLVRCTRSRDERRLWPTLWSLWTLSPTRDDTNVACGQLCGRCGR